MISEIIEFLESNFFYLHPGYTPLNTVAFGIILGIVVLIILRMFRWLKKDPGELLVPLLPFIFLGSGARALVDNGVYPLTHLLVTPGIYILVGLTTIATLLASVKLEEVFGWDYRKLIFVTGSVLALPNLVSIHHINPIPFFAVLAVFTAFAAIFYALSLRWEFLGERMNIPVIYAHLFDASSTYVAVDWYGYLEQHVVPSALTGLTGTALVMFPLKMVVILAALYAIDRYVDSDVDSEGLKLVIFILGLAPGLRNFLSLSMAV
ncbi:hypothetical protein DNK57_03850 [Methanothermobacter thermautotrophicus]|jgi:uncharacterized membrane protein|uniref:DUF63 family protein n=1 Tax=Methanothermobacter thermautotrophicus TaxID=145262 RepID=A0A842YPU1_METTF|nr:DUF63 family protein [Methanothermobacter thermautotrophicus]MBE2899953.1 hypothetical protein [Methanothermobacter thermautotrophicus]MCQ8905062.1 DUF63 family protein [Methanothermobacter sp.]